MAAAMVALVLTSCSKVKPEDSKTTQLSIKVSGVVKSLKSVEDPAKTDAGTIQLTDGYIFVFNPLGALTLGEALNVTAATTTGQVLSAPVPSDSRVYLIGNLPAGFTPSAITSQAELEAINTLIGTQTDYTKATLANVSGKPDTFTPVGDVATLNVSLSPVVSRLELTQVKGAAAPAAGEAFITEFTVTGVFVDDYYPSFNFIAQGTGTMFSQGKSTTFTGIGDTGSWVADATPIATPGTGKVWAHNLAARGVGRFILRLENVKYDDGTGSITDIAEPRYVTVKSYSNLGSLGFERGKIYRIGGANGISILPGDLALTPNPSNIDLTVEVTIVEWVLVTPDANI